MLRRVSQQIAFDEAAALVLGQHPELSVVETRRLVAQMLSNEPSDSQDTAVPISGSGAP